MDKRTKHHYSLQKEHTALRIWKDYGYIIAVATGIVFIIFLTILGNRFYRMRQSSRDAETFYSYVSQLQVPKVEPFVRVGKLPKLAHHNMAGLAEVFAESAILQKAGIIPDQLANLQTTKMPDEPFLRGILGYSRARISLSLGDPMGVKESIMLTKEDGASFEVFHEASAFIQALSERRPETLESSLRPDSPAFLLRVAAYLE